MKNLFYTLCFAILLVGCGKDGSIGPQGEKGQQGEQGPVGIPGKDGSVILQGTGAPASSLGKIGDMYLDKNTTNLYGPKDNSGWGTPLNLKGQNGAKGDKGDTGATGGKGDKGDTGATGAAGAAGSRILTGTTAPTASIGAVNDYYLNTTTGDLYGPKVFVIGGGTAWNTTPINLRGTANVIATPWFTPQVWVLLDPQGGGNYARFETNIDIPTPILNAIGQSNLRNFMNNGGTMIVYINNSFNGINMLPFYGNVVIWSIPTDSGGGNANRFRVTVNQGTGSSVYNSYLQQVRYVLIPPGRVLSGVASVGGRQISVDELKTMSYEQAGAVLGWEE